MMHAAMTCHLQKSLGATFDDGIAVGVAHTNGGVKGGFKSARAVSQFPQSILIVEERANLLRLPPFPFFEPPIFVFCLGSKCRYQGQYLPLHHPGEYPPPASFR